MRLEEITPAGPVVVGSSGALPAEILPVEDQKRLAARTPGQSTVGGGFFGGLDAKGFADIAPVWLAVAVPIVGAEIGVALMESGLMTTAAEASAAAAASGATAAQASAAAAAATAQATAVGTALANAGTKISQGVPADKAVTDAIVTAGVQTNSPAVAQKINELVGIPAITNLIASTGASIVQTAATGGNEADVIRNAKAAIVGSSIGSATGSNIAARTAGGAVSGGVSGAITGAAGAVGAAISSGDDKTKPAAPGEDPGVKVAGGDDAAALELARISAMPELLGREGEKAGPISPVTQEGETFYKRSITGVTPDGKPYGYVVTYDPGAPQGKQIYYETGYVVGPNNKLVQANESADGSTVSETIATTKRPTFDTEGKPSSGGPNQNLVIISDKSTGNVSAGAVSGKAAIDAKRAGGAAPAVISGLPGGGVIERPGYGTGDQQISALIGGGRGTDTGGGGSPGTGTGTGTGTKGTGTGDGTGGTGTGGGGTGTGDEEEPTPKKEDGYRPDLFIYGGKSPNIPGRQTVQLGTTLQPPFYPSSTLGQALTGYRGAGEIEGKKTGKPRRDVWNEESLRLKDALGL